MLEKLKNSQIFNRGRNLALSFLNKTKRLPLKKKIFIIFVFLFILSGEVYNFASYTQAPSETNHDNEQLTYSSEADTSPTPTTIVTDIPSVTPTENPKVLGTTTEVKTIITQSVQSPNSERNSPTPTLSPTPDSPTPTMGPEAATGTPTPTPAEVGKDTVNISIGSIGKYEVEINGQPKTCDVMRKLAQQEGLAIDIRHDNNLQTDSIWVINGIGNPNSIWWTYKVNGSSPPWGCSHVNSPTIKAGDQIEWTYIGPN